MITTTVLKTEILAIGSELLTPTFPETNSLFLIERLNDLGIAVSFKTVVGDNRDDLLQAFRTALRRAVLIIAVGGLGPTEDDRTREAAAEALKRKLVFNQAVHQRLRERFRRRGLIMPASNKKQCAMIEGAEILDNSNGTAPGLWMEIGARRLVLLPGPPRELKAMFEESVWPKLQPLKTGFVLRRVLKITGLSESLMEDKIQKAYSKLPRGGEITTLSSAGELQIRLRFFGEDEGRTSNDLAAFERLLLKKVGRYVFSRDGESLEEIVGTLLKSSRRTVACAESCTGGLLSHRLTNVPGSSSYFLESIVAYSNQAKRKLLNVPVSLIKTHGAVSAPVAKAMARGVLIKSGSDFGLAVTGIAGPSGGTDGKPVGLIYTALASKEDVRVEMNRFLGNREMIKFQSSQIALDMLRKRLLLELERDHFAKREKDK